MRFRANVAGASAQRKYNELTRSWRKRNRTLFVCSGLVCGAVVVGSLVAAHRWEAHGWVLGLLAGAALAVWAILRITPPGWIENWQTGAWGERDTARVLRPLERDGWVVLHDLPAGAGNIDHIVIGPSGVYVLDSKRLGGSLTVDEREATVHRIDEPELAYRFTGSRHLLSLASQMHDRILSTSRINTWVTPVLVVWSPFEQRVVEQRCSYVHGDELVAWLRARPQVIAPTRVPQLVEATRRAWATTSPV